MASQEMSDEQEHSVGRLQLIVVLALCALLLASAAGAVVLIADPDSGSTSEGVLGVSAAMSGLLVGVLVIAAFIYAQVKGLWPFAPLWVRVVLWGFIIVGVAVTLWNWATQSDSTVSGIPGL
jgi:hypothetical protein